jgi:nicotinate-nucleotide pyrophosphorylase (carboxylating)
VRRPPQLTDEYLAAKVEEALREDLGAPPTDMTTTAVVPASLCAEAALVAGREGVLAGLFVAAEVFRQADPAIELVALASDGERIAPGRTLARVSGRLRGLLIAERVALNFVQRLSGVATLTRRYADAVAGTAAVVLDTRKTTPGLRPLERWAVLAGGGVNHRYNLADSVLIKDNHVAAAGGVAEAVRRAHAAGLRVEVEVDDLGQLDEALAAGSEAVLLDNMTPARVAEAVRVTAGRVPLEVSGGVDLTTIADYARTGVDRISVGALTHSAPALDISMEVIRTWQ